MNRIERLGPPVRAAMAGIIAVALVCAVLLAAASSARASGPHAPSRARTLDWLTWVPDDFPGPDFPAADAAALAAESPSGTPPWRRPQDGPAGAPCERPTPSHITRISLPPPEDPIRP